MTWEDGKAEEPKTITRGTFAFLVFLTMFLLTIAALAASLLLEKTLGFRIYPERWIGIPGVLNSFLAIIAVDGVCKRLGLSRSGKTLEVRGRTVALEPEGDVTAGETIEVRCPSSMITGLGVLCLLICLTIAVILTFGSHERTAGIGWGYAVAGCFGLGSVYCFYQRRWGKPQAWADSSGIWAIPFGNHMRARFVPWSMVATCEINT